MMNQIGLLLAGGAARATVLAALGLILALIVRRRDPAAGALVALTTLSGLVAVWALSLAPWPRSWTVALNIDAVSATGQPPATDSSETEVRSSPAAGATRVAAPKTALAARGSWLSDFAREFAREMEHPAQGAPATAEGGVGLTRWRWPAWVAAGVLGSLALGLARLALAVRAVGVLRRRSRPVVDAALCAEADRLAEALGCPGRVEVRETDDLTTPAAVGCLRPAILLPADWRDWDGPERRAVLAHELAHVRRGDYAWGLWAQVCVALHAYQPLAHWLVARLRLGQELAADAWGASLSGGNRPYLAALARLALRGSGPVEAAPSAVYRTARPFLPTRGTLLRRIDMLRDPKPLRTAPPPRAGRVLTSGPPRPSPPPLRGPGPSRPAPRNRTPGQAGSSTCRAPRATRCSPSSANLPRSWRGRNSSRCSTC
jgi:beta-lactamase regulating signal transducer with metallopeptidase domain